MSLDTALRQLVRDVIREELETIGPKQAGASPSPYLSVPDAAERIGVHQQTIRDWIKAGHVGTYKAGRHHRVKLAELENFLARDGKAPPTIDLRDRARNLLRVKR